MILSEQITMREVVKKMGELWRDRNETDWQKTLNQLEEILASIGQKNITETGPISWLI